MVSPARIQTNRLLAKAFNLNDFLDPTRLAHDELQYYNDLTRSFDKIINHYIDWLDSSEAKKLFYEEIQNREEYFQTIDSDLDDIIRDTSLSADRIIEKVYRKGLSYGYKDINRLPVFNDACKYGLKATQEYNFELISNVSNDLIDSIRHHIFRGIAEGQSIHEVARAITDSGLKPLKGKTLSAYQRASLIARTEIARSMTTGRLQSYANYGVEKVKILTAGDDNVCPICRKAEKKIYTLEEASNLIPFHPACRCSVIAHIEHSNNPKFNRPFDEPSEEPLIIVLTNDLQRKPMKSIDEILEKSSDVLSVNPDLKIKSEIKSFINKTKLEKEEKLSIWDNNGNLLHEDITNNKPRSVSLPFDAQLIARSSGLIMTIHNHPVDSACLPSGGDLIMMAQNRITFGISTMGNRAVLVKNNDTFRNSYENNIINIYKSQYKVELQIKRDYISSKEGGKLLSKINKQLANGEISENQYKDIFYTEVEKFFESNCEKYCEMLNNVLSDYDMEVCLVDS